MRRNVPAEFSPLFSQDWRQLEQDLWRLETWLSHARAALRNQRAVPSSMEQLEDAISEHREFLMDLGRSRRRRRLRCI